MTSPTKVVLVACGSFNPITIMHLRMFELARDYLHKTGRYNVIGGIISPVSDGYGKKDLQPAKHRCAMIRHALKTNNWIRLDTWESDQSSWTETAKVLKHHKHVADRECNANIRQTPTKKRRKDLRNESINEEELDNYKIHSSSTNKDEGINVRLLCGADLLESFGVPGLWKDEDIEEIVNKYGLVCIPRAGSDASKFIYESDVLSKYQENIYIVTDWMHIGISATKIRRALRRGESVKYLVQDSVLDYIREHDLYSGQDNKYISDLIPSPNNNDSVFPSGVVDATEPVTNTWPPLPPRSIIEDEEPPRSPKRQIQDPPSGPRSPKSPRHVQCMTDIGTLVRRVRNSNLGKTTKRKTMNK